MQADDKETPVFIHFTRIMCIFVNLPSEKTNSGQYIFFRRITVTDGFVKLKYFLLEKAVTTIISCDV